MPPQNNPMGIDAPKSWAPACWEDAKDELRKFLKTHPLSAMRLAHVEGPHASGKSTGMLEYIWARTRYSVPKPTVIYVPSFDLDAFTLYAYLCSKACPYMTFKGNVNLGIRSTDKKHQLHILTSSDFRALILENSPIKLLRKSIVFLLDLELLPTADGELLFVELARWCYGRRMCTPPTQHELTLITMAPFSRPPLHDLLSQGLGTACHHILIPSSRDRPLPPLSNSSFMEDSPPKGLWYECVKTADFTNWFKELGEDTFLGRRRTKEMVAFDRASMWFRARVAEAETSEEKAKKFVDVLDVRALMDDPQETGLVGPAIVVQTDEEFKFEGLFDYYTEVKVYRISGDAPDLGTLLEAMVDTYPKIVVVGFKIPAVLRLPGVAAIVSYGNPAPDYVYDESNGEISYQEQFVSRMDILKARAYEIKNSDDNYYIQRRAFRFCRIITRETKAEGKRHMNVPKPVEILPISSAPAYGGELMSLSLKICASVDDTDGPKFLPPTSDKRRLQEMWRRLVEMGCLRRPAGYPSQNIISAPPWNEQRTTRTLEFLDSPFNEDKDVPLASFLARIQGARRVTTRRVMIRVALLIDAGISDILKMAINALEPGIENKSKFNRDIPKAVLDKCKGVGDRKYEGSVWIALGLFLNMEDQNLRGTLDEESALIEPDFFEDILEKVVALEESFGLMACEDVFQETMLASSEFNFVRRALTQSWLCNVVFFKRQEPQVAKSMISLNEVKIQGLRTLDIPELFEKVSEKSDYIFAFTLFRTASNEGLAATALTLVQEQDIRALAGNRDLTYNRSKY
ncbi:hypothetical protein F5Y02DRAFT_261775 [Annulohypoxylon stygium]|nr:hypothetical protein F5Y02DRAFT_261775 [Annulohypoxylon stygium]